METYLKERNLGELIETFAANKIDLDAFKLLEEGDFTELVPELGPRRKVVKYWREFLINVSHNN